MNDNTSPYTKVRQLLIAEVVRLHAELDTCASVEDNFKQSVMALELLRALDSMKQTPEGENKCKS